MGKVSSGPNTDSLEEAVAILQHHDGVSCGEALLELKSVVFTLKLHGIGCSL